MYFFSKISKLRSFILTDSTMVFEIRYQQFKYHTTEWENDFGIFLEKTGKILIKLLINCIYLIMLLYSYYNYCYYQTKNNYKLWGGFDIHQSNPDCYSAHVVTRAQITAVMCK